MCSLSWNRYLGIVLYTIFIKSLPLSFSIFVLLYYKTCICRMLAITFPFQFLAVPVLKEVFIACACVEYDTSNKEKLRITILNCHNPAKREQNLIVIPF